MSNKQILLSLTVDEISIRKYVGWDGKKYHGYVNYGIDPEDDETKMAKEAFVIIVNCINILLLLKFQSTI